MWGSLGGVDGIWRIELRSSLFPFISNYGLVAFYYTLILHGTLVLGENCEAISCNGFFVIGCYFWELTRYLIG